MPTAWKRLGILAIVVVALLTGLALAAQPAKPATSSAQKAKVKLDQRISYRQKQLWVSTTRVRFWTQTKPGRHAITLDTPTCKQLRQAGEKRVCTFPRHSLAAHLKRLHALPQIIAWLKEKKQSLSLVVGDEATWDCISEYEDNDDPHAGPTGWQTNTGNPYYGGLQMDLSFQKSYGPPALHYSSWAALYAAKGTADKWTRREQMAVAEYARTIGHRGYGPWPNTAPYCV